MLYSMKHLTTQSVYAANKDFLPPTVNQAIVNEGKFLSASLLQISK